MKRKTFLFAVLLAGYPASLASADVFFDRDLFELENPGLPVLDFEGFAPPGGFIKPAPQPWAPSVFLSDPGGDASSIAIAGIGFFGVPSDALFMDLFHVPILASFDPEVIAVGFNIAISYGGLAATVEVFSPRGRLLASETFDTEVRSVFTTFIGFSGFGEIGSVLITPTPGGFVLIDNFAYGIPMPGTIALLCVAGFFGRRRGR